MLFVLVLVRMLRTLQLCTLEAVIWFPFHSNAVSSHSLSYWLSARAVNCIPKFRATLESFIYIE